MKEKVEENVINLLQKIRRSSEHPIATRDLTVNALTDCLSLAPVIAIPDSGQVNRGFFYIFEHATKDSNYNYFSSQGQVSAEINYFFAKYLHMVWKYTHLYLLM